MADNFAFGYPAQGNFAPSEEEKKQALLQSLMAAGLSMMAQGGRQAQPIGIGQAIGTAGLQGLSAYGGAMNNLLAQKQYEQEQAAKQQLQNTVMAKNLQEIEKEKAEMERAKSFQTGMADYYGAKTAIPELMRLSAGNMRQAVPTQGEAFNYATPTEGFTKEGAESPAYVAFLKSKGWTDEEISAAQAQAKIPEVLKQLSAGRAKVLGNLSPTAQDAFVKTEFAPDKPTEKWTEPYEKVLGDKKLLVQKNLVTGKEHLVAGDQPNISLNANREFRNEDTLRREFLALPEIKEYPVVERQIKQIKDAMAEKVKGGSAVAVDQALVNIYNKMMDPSSVVRESEFARTPAGMSLIKRVEAFGNKMVVGGILPYSEAVALKTMVDHFGKTASDQYNQRATEYKDLAKSYGFKPERVVSRQNALNAESKQLDKSTAAKFLSQAGGDKSKARELAKQAGYTF